MIKSVIYRILQINKEAMKFILLFVSLSLVHLTALAQPMSPSLRRDIYDFAVGDTFEYAGTTYQNMCSYSVSDMIIILAKQSMTNGVSYAVKVNSASSHPPCGGYPGYVNSVTFTDTLRYADLDSTIFYYHDSLYYHRDSVLADIDTIYLDSVMQYRKLNEHFWHFGACCAADTIYAEGLGLVSASYFSEDYTASQGGYGLQYYHKASGDVWGTARYFTVGIAEVDELKLSLYPNPSSGSVSIQTDADEGGAKLIIYDIRGRILMSRPIDHTVRDLELPFADGCYIWQMVAKDGRETSGKLLIQR